MSLSPRSNLTSPLKNRNTIKSKNLSIVSDPLDFSQMDVGHSLTPINNKLHKKSTPESINTNQFQQHHLYQQQLQNLLLQTQSPISNNNTSLLPILQTNVNTNSNQSHNENLLKMIEELNKKYDESKDIIKKEMKLKQSLTTKNSELAIQLEDSRKGLLEMQGILRTVQQTTNEMSRKRESQARDLHRLIIENKELHSYIETIKDNTIKLAELEKLNSNLSDKLNISNNDLLNERNEKTKLADSYQILNKKNNDMNDNIRIESVKVNDLTNKLHETNNLLKLSEHVKEELIKKNQEIQINNISLKENNYKLSSEYNQIKENIISEEKNHNVKLKQLNDELLRINEKHERDTFRIIHENEDSYKKLTIAQTKIDELYNNIKEKDAELYEISQSNILKERNFQRIQHESDVKMNEALDALKNSNRSLEVRKSENTKLIDENSDCYSRLDKYQTEILLLQTKIREYEMEIQNLNRLAISKERDYNKLMIETNILNENVNQLSMNKASIDDCEVTIEEQNAKILNLDNALTNSMRNSQVREKEVQKLSIDNTDCYKKIGELQNEILLNQSKIREYESNFQTLTRKSNQLEKDVNRITEDNKVLSDELELLVDSCDEYQTKYREYEAKTHVLTRENLIKERDVVRTTEELDLLKERTKKIINELETKLFNAEGNLTIFKHNLDSKIQEVTKLTEENSNIYRKLDKLQGEAILYEGKYRENESKILQKEREMNRLTFDNESLISKNEKSQNRINELWQKLQEDENEITDMSTDLQKLTTDNGNFYDKHKYQISEYEIKIHQLENSISILNRNIKSEKDAALKVNEELIECYTKLEVISTNLSNCESKLRTSDNELVNLKRNVAFKEKEIERKSNEKETLKNELNTFIHEDSKRRDVILKSHEKDISALNIQLEEKDSIINSKDNEIRLLKETIVKNELDITKYNDLCKINDKDSIQYNVNVNLQNDLEHKNQLIKALKNSLDDNKIKIDLFKTKELKMSEYVVQNRQIIASLKKNIHDLQNENSNLVAKYSINTVDNDQKYLDEAQKILASRVRGIQARSRVESIRADNLIQKEKITKELELKEQINAQKILASRVRGNQARSKVESMKQDNIKLLLDQNKIDLENGKEIRNNIEKDYNIYKNNINNIEKEVDNKNDILNNRPSSGGNIKKFLMEAFDENNFSNDNELDKKDKEQILSDNLHEKQDLAEQINAQKVLASRVRGNQARIRVDNMKKENLIIEQEKKDLDNKNTAQEDEKIKQEEAESIANAASNSNKSKEIPLNFAESETLQQNDETKPAIASKSRKPSISNGNHPTIDNIMDRYKQEELHVGDIVLARYRTGPDWYGATITDVLPNDLYNLKYDDGDEEDNCSRLKIRFLESIQKNELHVDEIVDCPSSTSLMKEIGLSSSNNVLTCKIIEKLENDNYVVEFELDAILEIGDTVTEICQRNFIHSAFYPSVINELEINEEIDSEIIKKSKLSVMKVNNDINDLKSKQVIIDSEINNWIEEFIKINGRNPNDIDKEEDNISMLLTAQNKCSLAINKKILKARQTYLDNYNLIHEVNKPRTASNPNTPTTPSRKKSLFQSKVSNLINKEKFASSLAVVDENTLLLSISKNNADLQDLRDKQIIIDTEINTWHEEFTRLNNRPPNDNEKEEVEMLYTAQNKCNQAIIKKNTKLKQAEDALQSYKNELENVKKHEKILFNKQVEEINLKNKNSARPTTTIDKEGVEYTNNSNDIINNKLAIDERINAQKVLASRIRGIQARSKVKSIRDENLIQKENAAKQLELEKQIITEKENAAKKLELEKQIITEKENAAKKLELEKQIITEKENAAKKLELQEQIISEKENAAKKIELEKQIITEKENAAKKLELEEQIISEKENAAKKLELEKQINVNKILDSNKDFNINVVTFNNGLSNNNSYNDNEIINKSSVNTLVDKQILSVDTNLNTDVDNTDYNSDESPKKSKKEKDSSKKHKKDKREKEEDIELDESDDKIKNLKSPLHGGGWAKGKFKKAVNIIKIAKENEGITKLTDEITKLTDEITDLKRKKIIIDGEIATWYSEYMEDFGGPPDEASKDENILLLEKAQTRCFEAIQKRQEKLEAKETKLNNKRMKMLA